ncbi:RYamide receptor [Colletes latitarsis]|uniref:RYamide receptor n=1 Tax=Colletes latitarsis TaxID=2605962 RepID=UPI0040372A23
METTTMNISDYEEDYEDYEEEPNNDFKVTSLNLAIFIILYGSISILAIMGNFLIMWIIATTRHMQSVTNIFIGNLALADVVIALFVIPFQFQAALLQRWNLPYFMCPFCTFVQTLSVNVSIFTLTAIAIDRHRAILKPLRAKPSKLTAKKIIVGIWVLAASLAVPTAIAHRVTMIRNNQSDVGELKPYCRDINISKPLMTLYTGTLIVLQYLIPLSIISYVYARVVLKLWGNKAPGNAEDSRDANLLRNKMRVIKMLIIIVTLFAICWLPQQMYSIFQYLFPKITQYENIHYIWFFLHWLAMSNSCYNPFIYGIYNKKFKMEIKQRYPFKLLKWSTNSSNDNTDTNKTQSTRTSIRYEWKRATLGSNPTVSSFSRSVPTRKSNNSFIDEHQMSVQRKKGIGNHTRDSQEKHSSMSSNKNEELYVFPSERQAQNPEMEELCL